MGKNRLCRSRINLPAIEDTRLYRVIKRTFVRGLASPERGGVLNLSESLQQNKKAVSKFQDLITILQEGRAAFVLSLRFSCSSSATELKMASIRFRKTNRSSASTLHLERARTIRAVPLILSLPGFSIRYFWADLEADLEAISLINGSGSLSAIF
jgi:hypothetical protein